MRECLSRCLDHSFNSPSVCLSHWHKDSANGLQKSGGHLISSLSSASLSLFFSSLDRVSLSLSLRVNGQEIGKWLDLRRDGRSSSEDVSWMRRERPVMQARGHQCIYAHQNSVHGGRWSVRFACCKKRNCLWERLGSPRSIPTSSSRRTPA